MLHTAIDPHGARFKFGRKEPIAPCPKLRWGNYLLHKFPAPSPSADYRAAALAALKDVYGNATAGDCTCAALYHMKAVILANAGRPVPYTATDVLNFYKLLSGWNGIVDDRSDTGLDLATVLNYATAYGLLPDNDKFYAWMEIDGTSRTEVQSAIELFTCVDFGVNMPAAWVQKIQTLKDGDTFDVAGPGNPHFGHSFMSACYDQSGVIIDTWALDIKMPWDAVAKYGGGNGGEICVVLDEDLINAATQKSPTGVNWTQLLSDFQSVGAG